MIIDIILDRYEAERAGESGAWDPATLLDYAGEDSDIGYAAAEGEYALKLALIEYVVGENYNRFIIDYIISRDWLTREEYKPTGVDIMRTLENERRQETAADAAETLIDELIYHARGEGRCRAMDWESAADCAKGFVDQRRPELLTLIRNSAAL